MEPVDSKSDEQLLEEHRSGVAGAFDRLMTRYAGELFAFLARFVGNASLADDLVQETFVQVHLAAESFDRSRSFKPWLYTIAANKARDALRSRGRRQETSLEAGSSDERPGAAQFIPADDAPPGQDVDREALKEAVRGQIERMPEHLRLVLLLGYFQQMPYAEIAQVLDIPVGTVKSRLHAAVHHFADLWRGAGGRLTVKP